MVLKISLIFLFLSFYFSMKYNLHACEMHSVRLRLLVARLVPGLSISSHQRINHHKYCISTHIVRTKSAKSEERRAHLAVVFIDLFQIYNKIQRKSYLWQLFRIYKMELSIWGWFGILKCVPVSVHSWSCKKSCSKRVTKSEY